MDFARTYVRENIELFDGMFGAVRATIQSSEGLNLDDKNVKDVLDKCLRELVASSRQALITKLHD